MEQEKLDILKTAVNQFYLGKDLDKPTISDQEFDKLRLEYELQFGSVKDLVDWPDQLVQDNEPEDPLDKTIVSDNDLATAVKTYVHDDEFYWCNLKYDGGAIKCIYDENGQLKKIQSTPDETQGIIRTEQFWDLVPHKIPKHLGIKCIRGEVLVDPKVYGKLARNKANGLINSTVSQDEILNEAFIRWYKLTYFDGDWSATRQFNDEGSITVVSKSRMRMGVNGKLEPHVDKVFAPAYKFNYQDCPKDAIVEQSNGDCFQADGVVVYSDKLGIKGFKFYFTDSAVTTVKDIIWNLQSNGSYSAVLMIDPVTLDDKYIQRVSSNGVPNMIGMSDNSPGKMGIGAKVRVILANTTIPKVVEVLEESDNFNWPTCECGYKLSENDIFGATLKCGNPEACSRRVLQWAPQVAQWLLEENLFSDCDTVRDAIRKCPKWFGYLLYVDRWDPFNEGAYIAEDDAHCSDLLIKSIENDYEAGFRGWAQESFKFTDLQWRTVDINIGSAFQVLRSLDELGTFDKIREVLK